MTTTTKRRRTPKARPIPTTKAVGRGTKERMELSRVLRAERLAHTIERGGTVLAVRGNGKVGHLKLNQKTRDKWALMQVDILDPATGKRLATGSIMNSDNLRNWMFTTLHGHWQDGALQAPRPFRVLSGPEMSPGVRLAWDKKQGRRQAGHIVIGEEEVPVPSRCLKCNCRTTRNARNYLAVGMMSSDVWCRDYFCGWHAFVHR